MKTIVVLLMITYGMMFTEDDIKYEQAMSEAIESLYNCQSADDYQSVANSFERIAQAEPDKWLPAYYATLSYLWKVNHLKDKELIDTTLDEAQKSLDLASKIAPEEDEIITLQGYIYMMRVTVDPANRGAKFGPKSTGQFQKALQIDPENPRALLLMGQMKYGTDQFFGADTSEACEMMKNAVAMLNNEVPESKLSPSWGKAMSVYALQGCQ